MIHCSDCIVIMELYQFADSLCVDLVVYAAVFRVLLIVGVPPGQSCVLLFADHL